MVWLRGARTHRAAAANINKQPPLLAGWPLRVPLLLRNVERHVTSRVWVGSHTDTDAHTQSRLQEPGTYRLFCVFPLRLHECGFDMALHSILEPRSFQLVHFLIVAFF